MPDFGYHSAPLPAATLEEWDMHYLVRRAYRPVAINNGWDDPDLPTLNVDCFHANSSAHRPRTQARVLYDEQGLYVFFVVHDRYVRSRVTQPQGHVCRDACVEFFTQPRPDQGYFNFEINCGGVMLLHYGQVQTSAAPGTRRPLSDHWMSQVRIHHTMPQTVDPEIVEPVTWRVAFFAPFALFEAHVGPLGPIAGSRWTANFYKCAADCSHPHWACWSDVGSHLSFHQPQKFAPLLFEA